MSSNRYSCFFKTNKGKLTSRRCRFKRRIQNDVEEYGSEVIESNEMKQLFEQKHHRVSTLGEHTLRVTISSVILCYILKKLHVNISLPAVVVASLCHDMGMINRYERFSSIKECGKEHPHESVMIARKIVSDIPEKAEGIIETHMWPVGFKNKPTCVEGFVVSLADKYNAVKDFFRGSRVNRTGIGYFIMRNGRKFKNYIISA